MNLNVPLLGLDGEAVDEDATLAKAVVNALTSPLQGDEKLDGKRKFELFMLAMKINDATGEIELSTREIETIKERVGRGFPPVVVGRIWQVLDPVGAAEQTA